MRRAIGRDGWRGRWCVWVPLMLLMFPSIAFPITPAGTVVPHSFQLRFGSGGGSTLLTSNQTTVTVAQLGNQSIVPPRSVVALPGQPVDFLHTISNQGNAADSFQLSASPVDPLSVSGAVPMKMQFFAKDGKTPLPLDQSGAAVAGPVPPGGSLDVILRVTPPAKSDGKQVNILVKSASQLVPARVSSVNDQIAVPVPNFDPPVKSVSPTGSVLPGAILSYTITFVNTGTQAATGVIITDPLDPLLEFIPGSASFSSGIAGGSASYDPGSRTVSFRIPEVASGSGGGVGFQAQVHTSGSIDGIIRNAVSLSSDQLPSAIATNGTETLVLGAPLVVSKGAGSKSAEAGDIVSFTVAVQNVGAVPLSHLLLHDTLPRGFVFLKGSSALNGSTFADPTSAAGELVWDLGGVAAGQTRQFGYRAVLTSDVPVGTSVNRVFAQGTTPNGNVTSSAVSAASVLVRASILGSKAIILGRVFVDDNGNGVPDPGEAGSPGIRIYLDDGSFTVTDADGGYSFTGVSAGNHVVKIDRATCPRGLRPVPFNNAFAGVGWSQFVTVPFGGPARADFALKAVADFPAPNPQPIPPPIPSSPEGTVPGRAGRLTVNPDRIDVPADGRSVVPFTIELLTGEGRRVAGEAAVTVRLHKGALLEPDADPERPGHQIRVHDGVGVFHVRAGLTTGADPIRVEVGGVGKEVDLYFSSPLRDFILVGIGSLTVGGKSVSGHVEPTEKDDRFENGFFHEERLSLFTRGKILGKYLLTAAYDSGKERREGLFQEIDPEKYYPVYGDASDIGYEAQSRGKLYVKVEAGRSYLIGGDYRTDLSENEFSRYDRALNGVRLEVNEPGVTLKGFESSSKETLFRDEFPGNGTSGYFSLSQKPVFENSERVRIETRDRYHTERVLSVVEKVRYAEYSIDYGAGRILFKEPVPTLDKSLNPITIVVTYQGVGASVERRVYGGRGVVGSKGGSFFGGTAVVEEHGVKNSTLFGLDAGVKFGQLLTLRGEGAVSDNLEHGQGSAWKSELFAHPTDRLDLGGYYRRVEADFFNPSMTGQETGTTKYGGKGDYRLFDGTLLSAESFVEKSEIQGTTLFGNRVGAVQKFSLWEAEGGYLRVEEERAGTSGHSDLIYLGGKGALTKRLEATLRREQLLAPSLVTDYQTKSYLRLDYRVSDSTRAFVTEEYQEGSPRVRQATLFGLETKLNERMRLTTGYQISSGVQGEQSQANAEVDTKLYEEGGFALDSRTGYQIQDALSKERGQAILGLNSRYQVKKGILFSSSFERVQTVQGSGGTGTAFTLAGEFIREKELKVTGRYEIKSAPGELTSLYALQGAYKMNSGLTLLAKSSLWDRDADPGRDLVYDGYLGTAFRPLAASPLQLLTLARFKMERMGSVSNGADAKSLILSAEPTYRIDRRWTLQGKYAGKLSFEGGGPVGLQSYTDLILAGGSFDLAEGWDLTAYTKFLNQYDAGVRSIGAVGSVGYRVCRNVIVSLGYNYARLDDRDLTGESFSGQGPFFGVKVKLDEEIFEREEGVARPASQAPPKAEAPKAAKPLRIPVLVPALAVVSEKEDLPLKISGSAELLTFLVNGEPARLPSMEVRVVREQADTVEVTRGRLKGPQRFRVGIEKPERVKLWHFRVTDLEGRPVHSQNGTGAPPSRLFWEGGNETAPITPGEFYQYQMEVIYRDNSSFASGKGFIGVGRVDAVLVSLSGGAFVFERWELTDQARGLLKEAARLVRAHPKDKVIIEGHTDGIGSETYNRALSKKRCDCAADYLVRKEGIAPARILRRFYGKSRPIADNATTPGRRLNRRVEVKGDFLQGEPSRPTRLRDAPFVTVNGSALPLDPDGRFAITLPPKAGILRVEMGDSLGRMLGTALPLPGLDLAAPLGEKVIPLGAMRDGYRVDQSGRAHCFFRGSTDADVTAVEIDGWRLPVDAKGSFSTELSLDSSENVFGIMLRNSAGCTRFTNLKVRTAPRALKE